MCFLRRKNVFDFVNFTDAPGDPTGHDLKLFALSTCGFCKRAITFLKEHNVSYSYVYVDKMSVSLKQKIKEEFNEKFKKKIMYPALIIDEKEALLGFTEETWKSNIGRE
jgi:glutaredoxin-like protein NrdH